MIQTRIARIAGLALVAGIALTSAACSAPAEDSKSQSEVIAPIIVDVNEVDGQTVKVGLNNVIDINADDVTAWSGEIEDPSVAEFIAGTSEGDSKDAAKTNPGVKPLKEGTTKVTMTSTDGKTVTFTVVVEADKM